MPMPMNTTVGWGLAASPSRMGQHLVDDLVHPARGTSAGTAFAGSRKNGTPSGQPTWLEDARPSRRSLLGIANGFEAEAHRRWRAAAWLCPSPCQRCVQAH